MGWWCPFLRSRLLFSLAFSLSYFFVCFVSVVFISFICFGRRFGWVGLVVYGKGDDEGGVGYLLQRNMKTCRRRKLFARTCCYRYLFLFCLRGYLYLRQTNKVHKNDEALCSLKYCFLLLLLLLLVHPFPVFFVGVRACVHASFSQFISFYSVAV